MQFFDEVCLLSVGTMSNQFTYIMTDMLIQVE